MKRLLIQIPAALCLLFMLIQNGNGQSFVKLDSLGNKVAEGDSVNGAVTYWYTNGAVKATGFNRESRPDSVWQYFTADGRLTLTEKFRKGNKYYSHKLTYFKSGNTQEELTIRMEGDLHNSALKVYRDSKTFYENGQKSAEVHLLNGKDTGSKYWSKKGKEITKEEWLKIND